MLSVDNERSDTHCSVIIQNFNGKIDLLKLTYRFQED